MATYSSPEAAAAAASAAATMTIAGALAWGTISVTSRRSITCSAAGFDGTLRLQFAGASNRYQIMSIDGDDLVAPILCSAGDLVVGVDSGGSVIVEIEPTAYVDGTQQSMTVTGLDAKSLGATGSPLTATSTWVDPYLDAVTAVASHIGLWSSRDVAVGVKATTEVLMTDISGRGEGNIQHVLTTGVAWSVVADGPTAAPSLTPSVSMARQQITAYGVITAALAAGAESGCFFQMWPASKGSWMAWAGLGGVVGTPDPLADLVAYSDAGNVGYNVHGGGGNAIVAHAGIAIGEWACYSWRRAAGTTFVYSSKIGGLWKGIGSNSSATAWTKNDELRLGYKGNAAVEGRISGVALFSADIGEAGLQAIFEAV